MAAILQMIFYVIQGAFTWLFTDLLSGFNLGYIIVSVGIIGLLLTYFLRRKDD